MAHIHDTKHVSHAHCCNHEHGEIDFDTSEKPVIGEILSLFKLPILVFFLLGIGLSLDFSNFSLWKTTETLRFTWYLATYLLIGLPVLREAYQGIRKGEIFSEFFLMSIATLGAFAIGEYPEGVAVMLFYAVGEIFQDMAVSRASRNIRSLLDQRPDEVTIIDEAGNTQRIKAQNVQIGDTLLIRQGEKVGLDGVLISEEGILDTSALTGESVPQHLKTSEKVLAGMINQRHPIHIKVSAAYQDSKLSQIIDLVRNASSKKAPTELFIRKFSKIYTPIVVYSALAICFLPYLFVETYIFEEWLYRALIFLVVSCPCALVISIPLGYFGGIGAASKNGVLVKGGNYLDTLAQLEHVVLDKTGTLTEGVFEVQDVILDDCVNKTELLAWVNALESHSTHPIATAIHRYVGSIDSSIEWEAIEEIAGHGLRGKIMGKELLVGNFKLLDKFHVKYDDSLLNIVFSTLAIAFDQKFIGYITISDRIKEDSALAIQTLQKLHIQTTLLSGDKDSVVQEVAKTLGITQAYGNLLPDEKVEKLKTLKEGLKTAFIGDGINDAPAIVLSDVGIAMGGLGSDGTIESADVVIQDDKPSKIPLSIFIGKATRRIVWQNIMIAFAVKLFVLVLGTVGLATMWQAVIADVGVTLIAIFNAIRIQQMDFKKKVAAV